MAIQQGQMGTEDCNVFIESEPVSRLKFEYKSLRRHVCCVHFMTVFFCLTCCLVTVMLQSHASGCKEYPMSPATGMQKQVMGDMDNELSSSEKTSQEQIFTPFIRLTSNVTSQEKQNKGNVRWKINRNDSGGFFSLDGDGESLIVHHDGTYKVLLQIAYRGLSGQEYKDKLLRHKINLYTAAYPDHPPILMNTETVNFKDHFWKKTLFSEAVCSLNKGDRLKVWSENYSLIDVSVSQHNVFVVYPIFVQK
nr:uncharacterized protein si:ch211-158d24.4 [Misgurnus anguillicaudatus]